MESPQDSTFTGTCSHLWPTAGFGKTSNQRAKLMDIGAFELLLFRARVCRKAGIEGGLWVSLSQQTSTALSGPGCQLGLPGMKGAQPLPSGSRCWGGGSEQAVTFMCSEGGRAGSIRLRSPACLVCPRRPGFQIQLWVRWPHPPYSPSFCT